MNRRIVSFLSAALLLIAANLRAEDPATASLTVVIDGVKAPEGSVQIGVFASAENWLKDGVAGGTYPATSPSTNCVFPNLAPGEYAVSVLYDRNGNGELDKGAMGIPKEPYGFSNDARGVFGPAKWSKAKFTLPAGSTEIHITLK